MKGDVNAFQKDMWTGQYLTLTWLLLAPTFTMMIGSICIFYSDPGPKTFSGMQHLAAGILIGAIVWEVGPHMEAHSDTEREAILIGFIFGFGLLMVMARFKPKWNCFDKEGETQDLLEGEQVAVESDNQLYNLGFEESNLGQPIKTSSSAVCPIGLIAAVWMNGAIDGTLIGIAYLGGASAGVVTALALAIEQGLLGITTAKSVLRSGFSKSATIAISLPLALPIPICGLIAGVLLANISGEIYIAINSFGMAGLLYLVTEELLVEAHEDHHTDVWYVTINFFVGVMFVIVMDNFLPHDL